MLVPDPLICGEFESFRENRMVKTVGKLNKK